MKAKGSNAERQLVAKFWSKGFASIRVAGSGSSRFPCPDVLASNGKKYLQLKQKLQKKNINILDKNKLMI